MLRCSKTFLQDGKRFARDQPRFPPAQPPPAVSSCVRDGFAAQEWRDLLESLSHSEAFDSGNGSVFNRCRHALAWGPAARKLPEASRANVQLCEQPAAIDGVIG